MVKNSKTLAKPAKKDEIKKDICFTIMPFGGWFDEYYQKIYSPAIESAGLVPRRADDLYRTGTIINDIWDYTRQAKIILADLTGRNPNVLYELGLAHALAKPAILLTESMDDIPFDLRSLRIIEYDKNLPNWGDKLKGKIKTYIRETLKSPLKAVLPTFIEVKEPAEKTTVTSYQKDIMELRHEINNLKSEIRSISAPRDIRELSLLSRSKPLSEPSLLSLRGRGRSSSKIDDSSA